MLTSRLFTRQIDQNIFFLSIDPFLYRVSQKMYPICFAYIFGNNQRRAKNNTPIDRACLGNLLTYGQQTNLACMFACLRWPCLHEPLNMNANSDVEIRKHSYMAAGVMELGGWSDDDGATGTWWERKEPCNLSLTKEHDMDRMEYWIIYIYIRLPPFVPWCRQFIFRAVSFVGGLIFCRYIYIYIFFFLGGGASVAQNASESTRAQRLGDIKIRYKRGLPYNYMWKSVKTEISCRSLSQE